MLQLHHSFCSMNEREVVVAWNIVIHFFEQFCCCSAVAGWTCPLTYLFPIWILLMFIKRAYDDGRECERKHGSSSWTRYCQRVRSRLIPYIYWHFVVCQCADWDSNVAQFDWRELFSIPYRWQLTRDDWLFRSLCSVVLLCSVAFSATDIISLRV